MGTAARMTRVRAAAKNASWKRIQDAFLAAALTRVMRAAVPIPAVAAEYIHIYIYTYTYIYIYIYEHIYIYIYIYLYVH